MLLVAVMMIVGCSATRVDPMDTTIETAKYRDVANKIYLDNKVESVLNDVLYLKKDKIVINIK